VSSPRSRPRTSRDLTDPAPSGREHSDPYLRGGPYPDRFELSLIEVRATNGSTTYTFEVPDPPEKTRLVQMLLFRDTWDQASDRARPGWHWDDSKHATRCTNHRHRARDSIESWSPGSSPNAKSMGASHLATILDQEMLERIAPIAPRDTRDAALPLRRGLDVADELGGRLLVRYMLARQLGQFGGGSTVRHWVTPTPISPSVVCSFLALPAPNEPRPFAMLIDPAAVAEIQGPRWVRGGAGIEYLLPIGFPASALPLGWELNVT